MGQAKVLNVAIVGGGPGCKAIMDMIFAEKLSQLRMKLIGVACTNPNAVGYLYAVEKGIFTTKDYRDLYKLKDLDMIIELTGHNEVADEISRTKPGRVRLMGNVAARLFWDIFQIEEEGIAERKQAEDALRKGEERYRRITEAVTDYVFTVRIKDGHPMETVHGPACVAVTGYTSEELASDPYLWIQMVHEEDRAAVQEQTERVLSGQDVQPVEHRILRKDGVVRWVRNTIVPHYDPQGNLLFYDGLISDIHERKEAEEEKVRLEAQFHQAQKMEALGTLASGIAHDFNNLLLGIQGHTSLMSLDIDSAHPHFEYLKGIDNMIQKGADLTRQLVGFARGSKHEVRPTDLNELVARSSEMFSRTRKEIRIHSKYQEGPWMAKVNQGQIEQVLLNLYVNAWQAMPGGGDLYLQTTNVVLDETHANPYTIRPGNYVKVSIIDTGMGIDEETRQRIFEPFFTTKEIDGGSGLGLASAYGIIKNHGGIINVHSEKGNGTTFDIYLPAISA
ncbi:MAG: PAS domain S-box protein [Desulfobacterales bacterium]|nr:PAS domain S-box protein [Desulfobacterales bacterium]